MRIEKCEDLMVMLDEVHKHAMLTKEEVYSNDDVRSREVGFCVGDRLWMIASEKTQEEGVPENIRKAFKTVMGRARLAVALSMARS